MYYVRIEGQKNKISEKKHHWGYMVPRSPLSILNNIGLQGIHFFWQRTVFVCKTILATILISSSESRIYGIGPTFVFIELTKISGGSVYMKIICDGP